jgi:FkbM family methyltransferase
MSLLKEMLNPISLIAARTCEKSQWAASFLHSIDFKGKGLIVEKIRPGTMAREVVAKCNGIQYKLDLGDDVQRELYFNVYERRDLSLALEFVPPGGTCLDIGANNGAYAMQFAKKVGPMGTVHAYEPDPIVFSRLQYNGELNGFSNVLRCHRAAVSNVNGPVVFHRSALQHSGWGSLVRFGDIAVGSESVDAITLDTIVATENLDKVDLLKVDVEAHEPELLDGAKTSLADHVFRVIMIEFNGIRLAERGKTLEDFLRPLSAAGYSAVQPGTKVIQRMMAREVEPDTVIMNLLFTPTSKRTCMAQH